MSVCFDLFEETVWVAEGPAQVQVCPMPMPLLASQAAFARRACLPCFRRCLSSTAADTVGKHVAKPVLITTPIFYVNASPHIGHLYSALLVCVNFI